MSLVNEELTHQSKDIVSDLVCFVGVIWGGSVLRCLFLVYFVCTREHLTLLFIKFAFTYQKFFLGR
jgi:hypothetical protein